MKTIFFMGLVLIPVSLVAQQEQCFFNKTYDRTGLGTIVELLKQEELKKCVGQGKTMQECCKSLGGITSQELEDLRKLLEPKK